MRLSRVSRVACRFRRAAACVGVRRQRSSNQSVYLLDTNVISELRRPRPNPAVTNWISIIPAEQLFLSAVTLGGLQAAVEVTREQDPVKADAIERWLDAVAGSHNILPADGVIFRRWARLMRHKPAGLVEDAIIAATALVHNLTVATRNMRDFKRLGVPAINPFQRAR